MSMSNSKSNSKPRAAPADGSPWWRYPMVWLVVSGPLVVVVAAVVTAVIAVRGADIVVTDVPQAGAGATADSPAIAARNHAATAGR